MTRRPRQSQVIKMLVAFPPDVRAWIEAKADLNLAPMNSVIVASLRRLMEADQHEKPEAH